MRPRLHVLQAGEPSFYEEAAAFLTALATLAAHASLYAGRSTRLTGPLDRLIIEGG